MKQRFLRSLILAAPLSLALTGCQSAMPSFKAPSPTSEHSSASHNSATVEWPLKFQVHYFDAYCFSTYGCKVLYHNMPRVRDPDDKLKASSQSLENYPDLLTAGMGPIPNFPSPAKVTWRSKDGIAHETDIDIGEIFKDQLIRHNVAREDVTENATDGMPGIVLEVNDRTINVYMRANIWLKHPRFQDRPHSDYQHDLIKVFSRTY